MKRFILLMFSLPVLSACHIENDFYDDGYYSAPVARVERPYYSHHRSRGNVYYRDNNHYHGHGGGSQVIVQQPHYHGHADSNSSGSAVVVVPGGAQPNPVPVPDPDTHNHGHPGAVSGGEIYDQASNNVHGHG